MRQEISAPKISAGGSVEADSHSSEETKALTRAILTERRERLRKRNRKLDFELRKQEERYGDLEEMRRDVQRAMVAAKIATMRQGERTDLAAIDAKLS